MYKNRELKVEIDRNKGIYNLERERYSTYKKDHELARAF